MTAAHPVERGKMEDLIARLVEVDGPSRELDAEIFGALNAEKIIGLYPNGPGGPFATGHDGTIFDIPAYTGSLDAQKSLAHPDWQISSGNCNEDNAPWACVTTPDNVDHTGDGAATEILARLIALLKATAAHMKES